MGYESVIEFMIFKVFDKICTPACPVQYVSVAFFNQLPATENYSLAARVWQILLNLGLLLFPLKPSILGQRNHLKLARGIFEEKTMMDGY